jgi:predicted nucleic acid-binding protein
VYLVDTNVLSAGAPTKAQPSSGLADWMDRNSGRLHLSVITIAEVEEGIAKAHRTGASRKADRLASWLETLLHLYCARILPLDLPASRALGRLADRARGGGLSPGLADLAIAATAQTHGLTILTRNLRHFRDFSIPAHDPFDSLPPA